MYPHIVLFRQRALVLFFLALLPLGAQAEPPGIIHHQGRIAVDGVNFDGVGFFKFALVNAAGDVTYWTHNGEGSGGNEPNLLPVSVTVSNGHYAVGLGDLSIDGMNRAIPAEIFAAHGDIHLRSWFSTEGQVGTFELLSPDQRLTSTGYALCADKARNAWTLNGLTAGQLLASAAAEGFSNLWQPSSRTVDPGFLSSFKDVSSTDSANSVAVAGGLAYVTAAGTSNALSIFDVSNPTGPEILSVLKNGDIGINLLTGARSVAVSGGIAYVVSTNSNALALIDVSDPTDPRLLGSLRDSDPGVDGLDDARDIKVVDGLAYVASADDNALAIFDVSNPVNPQFISAIKDDDPGVDGLDVVVSVAVSGDFAYTASFGDDDALAIFNISDPQAPQFVSALSGGTLIGANTVALSGNVAYVTAHSAGTLNAIDISNPSSPVILDTISKNEVDALDSPRSVKVSGDLAFVASWTNFGGGSGAFEWFDISNPNDIQFLGSIKSSQFDGLISPGSIAISGGLAFLTSFQDDALTLIDLVRSVETQGRVGIGTSNPTDPLHVNGTARFDGNVGIGTTDPVDSLDVMGKIRSRGPDGGQVTVFNPANQAASMHMSWHENTARLRIGGNGGVASGAQNGLDIQTTGNSSLMRLRGNGDVGIGTTSPQSRLHVNGTVRVQGVLNAGAGTVVARSYNYIANSDPAPKSGDITNSIDLYVAGDIETGQDIHVGGAVKNLSDRNAKEAIEPINTAEILDRVAALPITSWQYKSRTEDDGKTIPERHIGPMAQDFQATFGLSNDDKSIATVDADGVALAAIQALKELSDRKDLEIKALKEQNAAILARLEAIESGRSTRE